MSRRRHERRSSLTALAALTAIAVLSACSSSKTKPIGAGPNSTAATTSTTTVAQVQAAIISQWRAAEEASVAAAKDPGNPSRIVLLVDYFVDPALAFLRTQYAANARDGLITMGDADNGTPAVKSMTASTAVVVSCVTNRLVLVYKATGKPFPGKAGDPTPVPNGITSTMVLTPSGVWKLSTSDVKDGTCAGL